MSQFIRAYLPGVAVAAPLRPERDRFLTVVVRTDESGSELLAEALLSLLAQTSQDFDVVVCGATGVAVAAIAPLPEDFRSRVHFLDVPGEGDSRSLNEAFQRGDGRFLAVLDEGDIAFAHWVETFAAAATLAPGRLVRALSASQAVQAGGGPLFDSSEPVDRPRCPWPPRFSLAEHLCGDRTPICGWAFPRSCFEDLGLRVDEAVAVGGEWHFSVRAALLCGVVDVAEVTSLRRVWPDGQGPAPEPRLNAWKEARARLHDDLCAAPWPADGTTMDELIGLQAEVEVLRAERNAALPEQEAAETRLGDARRALHGAQHELTMLRASTSWRVTRPLRWLSDQVHTRRNPP